MFIWQNNECKSYWTKFLTDNNLRCFEQAAQALVLHPVVSCHKSIGINPYFSFFEFKKDRKYPVWKDNYKKLFLQSKKVEKKYDFAVLYQQQGF